MPSVQTEVIESSPSMIENWRSSGVATAVAIVSGLAPGRFAETEIVGKSTLGKSLTDNCLYAMRPNNRKPSMTRQVATGRRMNVSLMLILKMRSGLLHCVDRVRFDFHLCAGHEPQLS